MKLEKVLIPNYTIREEKLNSISHAIGIALSICGMILGIWEAILHSSKWGIVSMVVYGASLIILYSASTLYHASKGTPKKLFRILDHCCIFLLIAGTYTPYCLVVLRENGGMEILILQWVMALIGILFNAIDLKKYNVLSMICYLTMGWCIIFSFSTLIEKLGWAGVTLLLLGGIFYTIGAILYGIGKSKKYFHFVWHICILIASVLQFLSILLFVIR